MEIQILHCLAGARQARGLAVVIDVFRAFSLECYLASRGAREIRPVATLEEAFAFRAKDPQAVLVGERHGAKCEGFDFGNSPSSIPESAVRGRRVIHTTSAGTQGITAAARGADEVLTGSLLNAAAIARYIRAKDPALVSLVAMGTEAVRPNAEDELCAAYIQSLLLGDPLPDLDARLADLRYHGGEHFFNPNTQHIYPEPDFWLCAKADQFDFILRAAYDAEGMVMQRIEA